MTMVSTGNFSKCDLHIPHKSWAEVIPDELAEPDSQTARNLQYNVRLDLQNWAAIEYWANIVAPGCFSGGCGDPGDGENSCVFGLNNTTGSDQSIVAGLNNTIDTANPNSVIAGGEDNELRNGNNVGDNIILAGSNNVIDSSDTSATGGDSNLITGVSYAFAYGSSLVVLSTAGVAFGELNTVTDESANDSFVSGQGAVAWTQGQFAHASNATRLDDHLSSGLTRSTGQRSTITLVQQTVDNTPSSFFPGLTLVDLPYAIDISGRVIALNDISDVVSVWEIEATIVADGATGHRFVGTPTVVMKFQDAGAAGWAVECVLETNVDTDDTFNIQVTGDVTDPTNFNAVLNLNEILGGTTL